MIILSLFDGCSMARVALERAGIKVDKYYASEIDKYAIQVSQKNYPDIVQLGSITEWKTWDIEKPNLIIGGSPCQGFSFAGKQLNFDDERSKLFFTFVDILKHYNPDYFLLENVVMKKKYNDVISGILGELYPESVEQKELFRIGRLEPIMINSALLSAQNRKRLYWCNWSVEQPEDKGIVLKDTIEDGLVFNNPPHNNKFKQTATISYRSKKMNTLLAYAGDKTQGVGIHNDNLCWRKLTLIECNRLQTLPDNYTNGVSNRQQYKMLGNGFTVDVIAHILRTMGINE
jgi:DNA-cytosine methyltransferase